MKAVVELTKQEAEKLSALTESLKQATKGTRSSDWFNNYREHRGYAHYQFSGEVSDKLIEMLGHMPTADEIIIIVDDGFSHFGASCNINGRSFSGRVNTD